MVSMLLGWFFSSTDTMSTPSDSDLPPEIVTVLPADPYEQLEIARKITSMAITSRVGDLDSSMKHLTRQLEEKDITISHLEGQVSELQLALEQSNGRLSGVLESQVHNQPTNERLRKISRVCFPWHSIHFSYACFVGLPIWHDDLACCFFLAWKRMETPLGIICFSLGLG